MTTYAARANRSPVRYLVAVIILLVLLVGLGLLYYFLTRQPTLDAEQGTKDRNYLFSIYGFEGDLLRRPSSVGTDPSGNIYVADTGKKRIVVFDKTGKYVTSYGDFGKEKNQLWDPIDVAVAPDGRSYVLDKTLQKIVMYDTQKKPIKDLTFDKTILPLSVTVANNRLFVTTESGVLVSDLDGKLITGYINRGKKPGQFDMPGGVAVGEDGTIYVADSLNYRVQAIKDGKPVWQYGTPIPADKAVQYRGPDRKFGLPSSISLDENGNLYVVDGLNSELVVLNTKGEFIEKVGDVGHADGTFYYPDGITYGDGKLVVADKFNDRVEVFRVPSAAAATTTATRYIPWALLLLAIPLLLLLLRRRTTYVATPAFVNAMGADVNGPAVAKAIKRLRVSPEVATTGAALEDLKLKWQPQNEDETRVNEIKTRYSLDDEQARSLDIAIRSRGKRVLLAEEPAVRQAAEQLGVPTLTYQELAQTLQPAEPAEAQS